MRILGIDPGFATVGLGLIETQPGGHLKTLDWLTITSPAGMAFPERLREIHDDLHQFVLDVKPDLAVVERLFFETNKKTGMDVAHARGIILLTLCECAVPIVEPTPLQMKLAITGDGKADKSQVQQMLMQMLSLSEIPTPDDAADALALAAYGAVQRQLQPL